jgi:hypothetical protein
MKSVLTLLPTLLPYALLGASAWIARHLKKPSDLQRAQLIATLARDAAIWAVKTYPGRSVPELVKLVVETLANQSGIPTTNTQALERAAHTAVDAITSANGS